MRKPRPDLVSSDLGTIITIEAISLKGAQWMRHHVGNSGAHCEHRYGVDILQGAFAAGLVLKDATTGRLAIPTEVRS